MFKKLSASVLALALVAGVFAPAQAQTLGLYLDNGGELERFGDVTQTAQFDIVVLTDIPETSCLVEFVMTEIAIEVPGVFKTGTVKINDTTLELGDNSLGEYITAYGLPCAPAGLTEVIRVTYGQFQGSVGNDFIVVPRGFGPGDTQPSSFDGDMGYVDSSDVKVKLAGEPWPGDVGIDPTKGPTAVASGDGVCVLNALATPNEATSMTSLKARF